MTGPVTGAVEWAAGQPPRPADMPELPTPQVATTTMQVVPIGWTAVDLAAMQEATGQQWIPDGAADGGPALAEFAGRACYQSWSKPNPQTATNAGYLKHILEVGHLSVLEHGSVTFYISGISRSLTHELIRHRHFSYSQLSQRYVSDGGDVVEPDIIAEDPYLHRVFGEAVAASQRAYAELAHALQRKFEQGGPVCPDCASLLTRQRDPAGWWCEPCRNLWASRELPAACIGCGKQAQPLASPWTRDMPGCGVEMTHFCPGCDVSFAAPQWRPTSATATARRKQARQAARAVLPNATETRIVVTGNYRAWRHFLAMRATEHADVEIRALAVECLRHLKRLAPAVFGDFEVFALPDGTRAAASAYTWES